MLVGRVSADGREPIVTLVLLGRSGRRRLEVEAVVDTGFTGKLSLPPEVALEMGFPGRRASRTTLADGRTDWVPVCLAGLVWRGRNHHRVRALVTGREVLVGMGLLRGSRLTVDAEPGGDVLITELP